MRVSSDNIASPKLSLSIQGNDVFYNCISALSNILAVRFLVTRLWYLSCHYLGSFFNSLERSSSSFSSINWPLSEILVFLNELTMVVSLTWFHSETSNFRVINNVSFRTSLRWLRHKFSIMDLKTSCYSLIYFLGHRCDSFT